MNTKMIASIGILAGLYAVITIAFAPISYGPLQVRVSEALTILPFFFPEAVVGLFIGCIFANVFGGLGLIDIVVGSLATLLAAYLTAKMRHPIFAPLPPVLVNAVVVAFILHYTYGYPLYMTMLYVGAGEFFACYGLGLPLLYLLKRRRELRPKDQQGQ